MSIKSELRIITNEQVALENGAFLKTEIGWLGTGTTWKHSNFNNAIRRDPVTSPGIPVRLKQTLQLAGDTISKTYFPGSKPYRVNYSTFGDNNTGSTLTVWFGGVSGTTRNQNGTYYDIFYVGTNEFLKLHNDVDYLLTHNGEKIIIFNP